MTNKNTDRIRNSIFIFKEDVREIIPLLTPILFEQFAFSLCSILISTAISRLGDTQVAGYNLAESINLVINNFITSLGAGVAVLVSQHRGKSNRKETGQVAIQALYLLLIWGSIISIVLLTGHNLILNTVLGGTEQAVFDNAKTFFVVCACSFPFFALYTGSVNIVRGSGHPKKTVFISIFTNVLYAVLSFVFIMFFNLGMYGPGLAIILARAYGAIHGVIMIKNGNTNIYVESLRIRHIDWKTIKLVLFIGVPIGVENVMFQFGRLLTQTFIIPLGTASLAANAIANNMSSLLLVPGNALQLAAIPLVGRYVGMDDHKKAKSMSSSCTIFCMMALSAICVIAFFLLDGFMGLYKQSEEVESIIRSLYNVYLILMPLMWAVSFVLPSALRAAGDVQNNMITAVVCMFVFRVGASFLLTKYTSLGIHGIWIGMYLDWFFRAIFFILRFRSGKWLTKKLV
ncbi:MAG: MATE family efflux transporter [Clostridiales bacterium]|nr:MATE family efflux transporter [Clostridiales bacterium]